MPHGGYGQITHAAMPAARHHPVATVRMVIHPDTQGADEAQGGEKRRRGECNRRQSSKKRGAEVAASSRGSGEGVAMKGGTSVSPVTTWEKKALATQNAFRLPRSVFCVALRAAHV